MTLTIAHRRLRSGMIAAFLLYLLLVTYLTGCTVLKPRALAIDRLCRNNPTCYKVVRQAGQHTFKGIEDAAVVGLAYLHDRYPSYDATGGIYRNSDGSYYFLEAGVGEPGKPNVHLLRNAVGWVYAKARSSGCDQQDASYHVRLEVLKDRDLKLFVSGRRSKVEECIVTRRNPRYQR